MHEHDLNEMSARTNTENTELYCQNAFVPWLKTGIEKLLANYLVSSDANNTCKQRLSIASETTLLRNLGKAVNSIDPVQQLAEALKANWDDCQLSFVGYTARPHHELTDLLCDIAIFVATQQQKQPLDILMPGIRVEHQQDIEKDLSADCKDKLLEILRTHILSDNRYYLFPVELLLDVPLDCRKFTLNNPFCDFLLGSDARGQLEDSEVQRLFNHSSETKTLFETIQEYKRAINKDSLFFHLNNLVNHLEFNSAHGGIGLVDKPGDGSYDAIIRFQEFYVQILEKQSDNIHPDVKEEVDFLYQLVSNPQANQQGSSNNAICIGVRKDKLRPLITKHAAALNAITLDESQYESHLKTLNAKFTQSQQRLQKSLANRTYEGCDPLGITKPLLERENFVIDFPTKEIFDDLLNNEPRELECILTFSDKLREQVKHYLSDIEVFVTFSLQTSPRRLEIVLATLGIDFVNQLIQNSDDLVTSLVLLSDETFELVFNAFKFRISDSFLLVAIERLDTAQLAIIFNGLKLHPGLVNYQDSEGTTPLSEAAYKGYDTFVSKLIKNGAEVDKADKYGLTPIYYAAQDGHLECVMMLLEGKAMVPKSNRRYKFSPLCLAAKNKDLNVINQLIKFKVKVNVENIDGDTPLCIAAESGEEAIVKALLKAKADVNKANYDKNYPIHLATKAGHLPIVRTLIAAGADINVKNEDGKTPLCIAVEKGDVSTVIELINARADVNKANDSGDSPIHLAVKNRYLFILIALIDARADIDIENENGKTPLCIAAKKGDVSIVNTLIAAKGKVNKADDEANTPLFLAAIEGHLPIVKALIGARADIYSANKDGDTPLCIATEEGYLQVVNALLEAMVVQKGVDFNHAIDDAIRVAIYFGHLPIFKALIEAQDDYNVVPKSGYYKGTSTLHMLASKGDVEMTQCLLGHSKANVNLIASDGAFKGCSPLFISTALNNVPVAKLFINHGASINQFQQEGPYRGMTPLHMAVYHGNLEIIEELLQHQAIVYLKQRRGAYQGCSPLYIAASNGHASVVTRLIESRAKADSLEGQYKSSTAIAIAALNGHTEVVRILIENGVPFHFYGNEVNTDFFNGSQPVESAAAENHLETVGLIEQALDIFNLAKDILAAHTYNLSLPRNATLPSMKLDDEHKRIFTVLFKNKELMDPTGDFHKDAFIKCLAQTELKETDIYHAFKTHNNNVKMELENRPRIVQFSTSLYSSSNSKDNLNQQILDNQENEPNRVNYAHMRR